MLALSGCPLYCFIGVLYIDVVHSQAFERSDLVVNNRVGISHFVSAGIDVVVKCLFANGVVGTDLQCFDVTDGGSTAVSAAIEQQGQSVCTSATVEHVRRVQCGLVLGTEGAASNTTDEVSTACAVKCVHTRCQRTC